MADEACAGVAASGRLPAPPSFEARAWKLLQEQGFLSRISPIRVRIVPKTNSSARGITIRSLSRHLALSYEAVDVRWRSIGPGPFAERSDYNIVLVPWPSRSEPRTSGPWRSTCSGTWTPTSTASSSSLADVVRRVGPSLVVAVLLDGPQLTSRWPSRYSSVLTDDPGAAVLTLTSYGMAARSRPPGKRGSRVVAHWNNPVDGPQEIELAPRAAAILLSMSVETTTLWTADGRSHADVPYLDLAELQQLRAKPT